MNQVLESTRAQGPITPRKKEIVDPDRQNVRYVEDFAAGWELVMDMAKDKALALAEEILEHIHGWNLAKALSVLSELEVLLMVETALYQALHGIKPNGDQSK